jgi:hypothetical protein
LRRHQQPVGVVVEQQWPCLSFDGDVCVYNIRTVLRVYYRHRWSGQELEKRRTHDILVAWCTHGSRKK